MAIICLLVKVAKEVVVLVVFNAVIALMILNVFNVNLVM